MTPTEEARRQRLAHLQDEMRKGFDLNARDRFEYHLLRDFARACSAMRRMLPNVRPPPASALSDISADRERLATALLRYAADMEEPEVIQDLHAAAAALRTPPAEETT